MYFPLSVYPGPTMVLITRTDGDPLAQVGTVREVLRSVDPTVPLTETASMTSVLAESIAQQRFTATLVGGFALAALGLAVLGLYGVISFGVARRAREIGVRLALGAAPGRVLGMVMWEGAALSVIGVGLGLAGAIALGRVLAGLMFRVSPTDPAMLAGVAAILVAVALMASLVPARRAIRIDPVTALREE